MPMRAICQRVPVIPVLVIEEVDTAAPLARALVAGGLTVLEVTLRTLAALDALRAIVGAVPDAIVGAGTLLTAADVGRAKAAGARFGVSPGCTGAVIEAARTEDLPLLPGVATPTEAMHAADHGLEACKFFPAEPAGGIAMLKAWAGPLPHLVFCPTGGITAANAPAYLALPNVLCVGGSWVAPAEAVRTGDWPRITTLAAEAARLRHNTG